MTDRDCVGAWLDAAARHPLLTHREELELGRLVRAWQDWPGGPAAAPAAIRRRGLRARDRMITANLRLVVAVAQRYRPVADRRGLPFADLLQEGAIGLARGVERFDPSRGYKASTFCFWWIRQAIQRAAQDSGLVHIPSDISDGVTRALREGHLQSVEPGKRERVAAALAVRSMACLDAPVAVTEGDPSPLGELVPAPITEDALEALDRELLLARLRDRAPEALQLLEDVEREGCRGAAARHGLSIGRLRLAAERARCKLRLVA